MTKQQSLNEWACMAKLILEGAYRSDALWTPSLGVFISECPATPDAPQQPKTFEVFLPGDTSPTIQNIPESQPRREREYDTSQFETKPFNWAEGPYFHPLDDVPARQRYAYTLRKGLSPDTN